MEKNTTKSGPAERIGCYLPDFCVGENILRLILVLQLVAIVMALASFVPNSTFVIDLALLSMLTLWIGLASAALLCPMRRFAGMNHVAWVTLGSVLVVIVVTVVVSWLSYQVNDWIRLGYFPASDFLSVLWRHLTIALVLLGLALRYFYVQHRHHLMLQSESRARLQALQARIRPHFLFNSLNTIASLTYDSPERAEHAIENLSDLFRASLKAEESVGLQQEIEFTRQYIELEQLRLDDRLRVTWQIEGEIADVSLPALTLQPLVENAIYHGIEPLADGGEVTIRIQRQQELMISISNPVATKSSNSHAKGNQMALQNIDERLQLAFGGRAKVEHITKNDLYTVEIRIV